MRLSFLQAKGCFLLRILQDVNIRMSITNKQAVREALIEGNEDKLHLWRGFWSLWGILDFWLVHFGRQIITIKAKWHTSWYQLKLNSLPGQKDAFRHFWSLADVNVKLGFDYFIRMIWQDWERTNLKEKKCDENISNLKEFWIE